MRLRQASSVKARQVPAAQRHSTTAFATAKILTGVVGGAEDARMPILMLRWTADVHKENGRDGKPKDGWCIRRAVTVMRGIGRCRTRGTDQTGDSAPRPESECTEPVAVAVAVAVFSPGLVMVLSHHICAFTKRVQGHAVVCTLVCTVRLTADSRGPPFLEVQYVCTYVASLSSAAASPCLTSSRACISASAHTYSSE
jgi:hypothetical protein